MSKIEIAFQAGFENDEVVVEMNNSRKIYSGLTTDYSIGLAERVVLESQSDSATLDIELPKRNQDIHLDVDLSKDVYVKVNLTPDGKLQVEEGDAEAAYF
ncbi:hypothetical protein [Emcibacter sp.]|uniref:hypothetical protein n=1 Tax=Emcibacter sp. TaxID=1979954 RepID=UPI003A92445A